MSDPPKSMGTAMREKREELGLSLSQVSSKSGLHENTIAGYEKDEHQPGLFNLVVLADTLGVGLDEYIGRQMKGRDDNERTSAEDTALVD